MSDVGRPVCILVVEDEVLTAAHIEAMLARLGFSNVECACDLIAAWTFLKTSHPSLAILDINLADTLVFSLAEELQARGVPIVFSSAGVPSELPAPWRDTPFLPKPIDRNALAAALDALGVRPSPPQSAAMR